MNDITIQNDLKSPTSATFGGKPPQQTNAVSFGQMLKGSLDQVNRLQQDADESINDLAVGKNTDIHQTMVAVEKASVSFELLMQIRNKVIAAYERVMRMPM